MDLLLDADHNLHVVEINLSPGLETFTSKAFMHHNLLRNLFNMLGIGSTYYNEDFHFK